MKKAVGFFLAALWSGQALSAHLRIQVQDVLDLATYGDPMVFSMPIDECENASPFRFQSKEWEGSPEGYLFEIKGHVTPIEDGYYFLNVQKNLYHNGAFVKTLLRTKITVKKGMKPFPMKEGHHPQPYAPTSGLYPILRQLDMVSVDP
jgi:hypothetical protein